MREVTEKDLRAPEYREGEPSDYEFRESDHKVVRKDRWERGIHRIRSILCTNLRADFEIQDVVDQAENLKKSLELANKKGWVIQNKHGLFLDDTSEINFVDHLELAQFFDYKEHAMDLISDTELEDCIVKYARSRVVFDVSESDTEEASNVSNS